MSMTAVVEGAAALVGIQTPDMKARQMLEYRQEESARIAADPVALTEHAERYKQRANMLILAELEDLKRQLREETERTCEAISRHQEEIQRHSEPVMDHGRDQIDMMVFTREAIARWRNRGSP